MLRRFELITLIAAFAIGAVPSASSGQEPVASMHGVQLTSTTQIVVLKYQNPGESEKTACIVQYSEDPAWMFDLRTTRSIKGIGSFDADKGVLLANAGKSSDILYFLDLRRREIESIHGVRGSFYIDSKRHLFAFIGGLGEVFVNHQRIFPDFLSDVYYELDDPLAYTVQDGRKVATWNEPFLAQGYYPFSAVLVKENLDIEVVLLKSKIGRPVGADAPPFFPKPADQEFYLIEAHPENPNINSPGQWGIKKTPLSKDEARSRREMLNRERTKQLQSSLIFKNVGD